MADKATKDKEGEGAEAPPAAKGGLSIKLLAVIGAIMAIEGVGVFLFVTMMSGAPKDAAAEIVSDEEDPEALVEIMLTDEQYQNMTSNQVWIWEAEIYLKVRRKNQEFVQGQLEQRSAEIQEGITQIFRRAKLTELREPDFRTGSRQLTALVNDVFGNDADGLPRVERLVIAKLRGFPRN
jgi:flagellar basal body-associated protein FliL